MLTVPQAKTINPAHARQYFENRLAEQFTGKAQILVRCPLHEDRNPSLSVNLDRGVWFCHAGCGDGGILDFEERFSRCDRDTARKNIDAILGEQLLSASNGRQPLATYRYTDARGKPLFEKLRYEPKDFRYRHEDELGNWVWNLQDVKRAPYNLPKLIQAVNVIYCEGEKDADNVATALDGVDLGGKRFAVTTSGGVKDWRDEYAPYFAGREVVILPDNDEQGRQHAEQVATAIHSFAAGVKIVNLPGLPEKGDASDYLETHSGEDLYVELWRHKQAWKPAVQPGAWRSLFHSYDEVMNAPPVRFAIEGFLQEEGVTLIGGLAGHGKTLCMLAMARALLEGGKLFHRFPVNQAAERVIYLIPEAGLGPFSARLKTFHLEEFIRNERLFCRTLSAQGPLSLSDPQLLAAVKGADVFLDTAIRFMEGDENGAEQRKFAETLFNLQRAGARTITGAHHSPKSFGKDSFMTLENVLRGSGDIGAMLVTCWGLVQIDPASNRIFVQNVKPRDFQPCEPFIIQGRPSINDTGYFELTEPPGFAGNLADHKDRKPGRPGCPDKNEKFTQAVRLKQQGKSLREIAEELGIPKSTVSDWFKKDEEIQ